MPSLKKAQGKHLNWNWNLKAKKSVIGRTRVYLPALTSYTPRACTISKSWVSGNWVFFTTFCSQIHTTFLLADKMKITCIWVLISYSSNFFSLQFLILSGPHSLAQKRTIFFLLSRTFFPPDVFLIKALSLHLGTSTVHLCIGKKSFHPRQIPGIVLIFTQWC